MSDYPRWTYSQWGTIKAINQFGGIEAVEELDGISTELMDAELLDKIYREHTDPEDEDEWNEFPEIRK
jgi:hypothetical protein